MLEAVDGLHLLEPLPSLKKEVEDEPTIPLFLGGNVCIADFKQGSSSHQKPPK